MSTQIKYKDKVITFESGTITLHTKDTMLAEDIEVMSTVTNDGVGSAELSEIDALIGDGL